MNDSPTRVPMLYDDDEEDFGDVAQDLENSIQYMRNTLNAIDMTNREVRAKRATDEMHREMLVNMQGFERFQAEATQHLLKLRDLAGVEIAKTKKLGRLQDDFNEVSKKYEMNQSEFQRNMRLNDALFKGSFNDSTGNKSSIVGAGSFLSNSGMPVMQVYNQEELIEERKGKIQKVNQDARDIKRIAGDIHTNIHDQDDKLDGLVKNHGETAARIKEGNAQLVEAKKRAARRQQCMICLVLMSATLVAILSVSVYVMFFRK